ncbi:MAG: 16S rRNA (uracil(1498)-N(3))-methyltransferase [Desulfobacterales bacterium]|nr:16S rRNA (uracil(1498)-N(3))-methyltransferase [Desulfobacterales bacterium]
MRRFFYDHPVDAAGAAAICGTDAKHIKNVLRLKSGDRIVLFDGLGSEFEAEILSVSSSRVALSILRRFPSLADSPVELIVAQGLLKDKKMDRLIRQLTELGVTDWIPFIAERSVPIPDPNRLLKRRQRWNKIAMESLKQCRRGSILNICPIASFEEVLVYASTCDLKIMFWEEETGPFCSGVLKTNNKGVKKIIAMFGPEGGLTAREVDVAKTSGFVTAGLGPRILRAETATLAACAILQHQLGDLGEKNLDNANGFE